MPSNQPYAFLSMPSLWMGGRVSDLNALRHLCNIKMQSRGTKNILVEAGLILEILDELENVKKESDELKSELRAIELGM